MGHYSTFLREAFHMLRLTAEERFGYEKREICIDMTCLLEFLVEDMLHLLPYRISVRLDHHTAPYSRTLRKVCLHYKVVIPLGVVVRPLCHFFCHLDIWFYSVLFLTL